MLFELNKHKQQYFTLDACPYTLYGIRMLSYSITNRACSWFNFIFCLYLLYRIVCWHNHFNKDLNFQIQLQECSNQACSTESVCYPYIDRP